jgi:PAS domain S-box-containing protein
MSESAVGKILIVDDEVQLKNALVEALASQSFEVRGFTSGPEVIEALREEDFDLLLSDLMMPGMNGIDLVKAALEIDPHLVAIIMTGQGTIQTAVDAMKVGAFDYVLKPFRLRSLMPVITRAIDTRRLRRENLQLRETVAIYELSRTIASTLDPQTVINKLADAALQQTDADEVSILLPTKDGKELYVAAVAGQNRTSLLGERVPLKESISGWVTRELIPLILNGEVNDARFRALWSHPEISSAIAVPMQLANKLIGTININAINRPRPFTLGQMKALTILASTGAAALESASLYSQVWKAEENYRAIFENAYDIIYTHDLDGRYTSVNKAVEQITGYTTEEALSLNLAQTITPECLDKAWEMLRRKLAGERVTAYEVEIIAKDGHRVTVEVNTKLMFQDGVPVGVQGIARDITERKRMEEALRASEEQLRQSQKLEAIGQLAGGVAHDFNNLLTAINGYSSLALRRLDEAHPIRSYLEEIKRAGDRAANLTRQLLAFGRKQMLQPLALNLNDIVADMNKMLRRLIGEDIHLEASLDPTLQRVKADPGQIEQVLVNLVVNARDAMPKGGNLTIETANIDLDQDYASKHVDVAPGKYVMLAVSDTGCGMDENTKSRIFEPFFTTKEKDKGTGLGLSTVYGIVKQSGGNIWVYSEAGRGSTFKIYLPRAEQPASTVQANSAEAFEEAASETVLLVEDNAMVRTVAREILEAGGYRVLETDGCDEALRCYKEHAKSIDLLLTDVVMPQMSGKVLADRLSAVCPDLKVLFMSGYTDEAIVRHGVLDSGVAFIQKPFAPAALLKKVHEVLGSGSGDGNR